jgi:hypothetical protein
MILGGWQNQNMSASGLRLSDVKIILGTHHISR